MKSRDGKRPKRKSEDQVREEKRRGEEDQKRESQEKDDAGARKGRKVANHCVFPTFVAPEGQKVGSLKWRVGSHVAR